MKLTIYNTLSRQKEVFVPLMEDPKYTGPKKTSVGLYSCWPTVYWDPHIWNMRAYVCRDILRNTLERIMWYPLISVMNLTDVGHLTSDEDSWEDKMEKWAKREQMTVRELANKYIESFKRYLALLSIDEYQILCRATDHIQEQIALIQKLEEKWYTYIIPHDGVYMDTSKISDYWELWKLDIAWLQQWARIENDNKKNKTDFWLWKFSPVWEKRQMEWESPWWVGFPWWHIECSAMSSKYLWEQFDLHTWWVDHISVHHTNEIAQSECGFWVHPWVKYWLHNQFLNLWGKKQSKSSWGLITIDTLIEQWYHPLDFRYLCLTAHYRNFLEYSPELLSVAATTRNNLVKKVQKLCNIQDKTLLTFDISLSYEKLLEHITSKYVWDMLEEMMVALMDDLNIPRILAILQQSLTNVQKVEDVDMKDFFVALHWLEKNLLKIGLFDVVEESSIAVPQEVKALADQRVQAKKDKNYALADELRAKIVALWYQIKDAKDWYEIIKE